MNRLVMNREGDMFTGRQIKRMVLESRKQKPRCHLGANGVTPCVIRSLDRAFLGSCGNAPTQLVRVKVHETFPDDLNDAAKALADGTHSEFVRLDNFAGSLCMIFYRALTDVQACVTQSA